MSLDSSANMLIRTVPLPGMILDALVSSGQRLIDKGRISHAFVCRSFDGTPIDVWVIANRPGESGWKGWAGPGPRGTVILLHPLMASKSWFLGLGEKLAARGWDVVLLDLRTHGRSGGRYITWGAKEKLDIRCVIDQLLAEGRIHEPIQVFGSSYGACVAIQYAAADPRCKGVIALAPPASLRLIGKRILFLSRASTYEAALKRAGELAEFDPEEASAVKAAVGLKAPLVLVHGWWDIIVPTLHSRLIRAAAAGRCRLIWLPLANHPPEVFRTKRWLVKQIGIMNDAIRSHVAG